MLYLKVLIGKIHDTLSWGGGGGVLNGISNDIVVC